MKKRIAFIWFLISVNLLSGCSKKSMPDTYVSGMDYQFCTAITSQGALSSTMQYVDGGAYFRLGDYIYYFDKDLNTIYPLCNKPDCLHDKETDPDKKDLCNAHINMPETEVYPPGLQYYNGNLYVMYATDFVNGGYKLRDYKKGTVLYRFADDGSAKEEIWRAQENWSVSSFIIHRGKAYIVTAGIFKSKDGVDQKRLLLEVNITGAKKQHEIYKFEEDNWTSNLGFLRAYGNHLYFCASSIMSDAEGYVPEDSYHHLYEYNIANKKLSLINNPDGVPDRRYISNLTFYKDQIVFSLYQEKTGNDDELYLLTNIYSSELDGSNPILIISDIPQGYYLQSDGKYLYINNAICAYIGEYDSESFLKYQVFDDRYNGIDEFSISQEITDSGVWEIAIGNPEWGCFSINNCSAGIQKAFYFEKDQFVLEDSQFLEIQEIPYDYSDPYQMPEYIYD